MDNKKATLELGTKPVGKLLAQYALPAIIAMTAASLYNIIDRVFIGQVVGPMAISGLAITFPFMNLAAAFGAAVGVGASTTISVKLGQKDYESAENILGNTITLNLIVGLAFGGICLLLLDPILRFFGASDATLPYARDFMRVILAGNVFSHMYFGMNAVLRAASKPRMAMFATIFTVGMNILLDVVFILWWHWGIKGAAFATIISQVLALCWQMKLFTNKSELLHLKRGIYKLKQSRKKHYFNRYLSFPDECLRLCDCHLHKQSAGKIWWRHGGRSIRHRQQHSNDFRNVCYRTQPRYAAHCRLQLRCAAIRQNDASGEVIHHHGSLHHADRVVFGNVCTLPLCPNVYNRPGTH